MGILKPKILSVVKLITIISFTTVLLIDQVRYFSARMGAPAEIEKRLVVGWSKLIIHPTIDWLNRECGRFSHGDRALSHGCVRASYSELPFDVVDAGYVHLQEAVLLSLGLYLRLDG
jgi:hypothetical protein